MMFEMPNEAYDFLIDNKIDGEDRNDALLYIMANHSYLSKAMRNGYLTQKEMIIGKWRLMRTSNGCFHLLKYFKNMLDDNEQEIVYQIMCEDPSIVYNYYVDNKNNLPVEERRKLIDIILISKYDIKRLLGMKDALYEDMNYILTICKDKEDVLQSFLERTYERNMNEVDQTYRNIALRFLLNNADLCYKLVVSKKATDIEKFMIHESNWMTYFKESRKSFKRMYEYAKLFNGILNLEEERNLILKVLRPDKENSLLDLKLLRLSDDAKELINSYYLAKRMASSQKIF